MIIFENVKPLLLKMLHTINALSCLLGSWEMNRSAGRTKHVEGWTPVIRFNYTSGVAVVTPTDRPKSVCNRCVIKVFDGVFVLSRCFLDLSVGVGDFIIGLISDLFLFLLKLKNIQGNCPFSL